MIEAMKQGSQESCLNSNIERREDIFLREASLRKSERSSSTQPYSNIASYREVDFNGVSMKTFDAGVPKITINDCRLAVNTYPNASSLILVQNENKKPLIVPSHKVSFWNLDQKKEDKRIKLALSALIKESFQNQEEPNEFVNNLKENNFPVNSNGLRHILKIETEARHGPLNKGYDSYQNSEPMPQRREVLEDSPYDDPEYRLLKDMAKEGITKIQKTMEETSSTLGIEKINFGEEDRIAKEYALHPDEKIPLLAPKLASPFDLVREPTPGIQGIRLLGKNASLKSEKN